MAVATRKPKPKKTPSTTRLHPVPIRNHYPEAPDRGERDREAPERRHVEAPDAGLGHFERDDAHGRSQS